MLCFEGKGHTQSVIMELADTEDDEVLDKEIAEQMEKQFKKLSLKKCEDRN